ncbi:hypothetical protein ABZZ47_43480, partial [Streptomyces sp. NPDC006465]|uniref:hypothetical protein n=1 Tax=Streptomyces sp. NPDC006465 TaxID=3157174 RepID=UPI0033B3ABDC
PTTLRISHTTGIPRRSHIVSPRRQHASKVSNAYSGASADLKKAVSAAQARHALRQIMFSDGLDICAAGLSIVVVWQLIRRLERAAAIAPAEVWTAG